MTWVLLIVLTSKVGISTNRVEFPSELECQAGAKTFKESLVDLIDVKGSTVCIKKNEAKPFCPSPIMPSWPPVTVPAANLNVQFTDDKIIKHSDDQYFHYKEIVPDYTLKSFSGMKVL